jgi:HTH-type transcriptional regulator/antitoxin HigA
MIDSRAAAQLAHHFNAIQKHVPLHPVRNAAEYDVAVESLNALLDAGAAAENHPLADLAATLGGLIADWDEVHFPAHGVGAQDVLQHLMEAHGLKQGDLPEIGSQGVVSEIMSGHRELNLRQVRALAQRFGVSPVLFIGTPPTERTGGSIS